MRRKGQNIKHNQMVQAFIKEVKKSKKADPKKMAEVKVLPTNLQKVVTSNELRTKRTENAVTELICEVQMLKEIVDNLTDLVKRRQSYIGFFDHKKEDQKEDQQEEPADEINNVDGTSVNGDDQNDVEPQTEVCMDGADNQ